MHRGVHVAQRKSDDVDRCRLLVGRASTRYLRLELFDADGERVAGVGCANACLPSMSGSGAFLVRFGVKNVVTAPDGPTCAEVERAEFCRSSG